MLLVQQCERQREKKKKQRGMGRKTVRKEEKAFESVVWMSQTGSDLT
jgi:hypothetical protein